MFFFSTTVGVCTLTLIFFFWLNKIVFVYQHWLLVVVNLCIGNKFGICGFAHKAYILNPKPSVHHEPPHPSAMTYISYYHHFQSLSGVVK